ncbi:hypothetical protein [Streptomyces spectabilis]|uniref:Uncharacterized protein n=1 Tax=Streptomyces spectabilis TaxID=68270 RepID=A0A516R1F0_STRST|nr:hypothetical protein [Streptomyces spectabilis]QDQ09484.1 hypothetical protein FH965_02015 [Streptomyces spectabilis]
MDRGRRLVGPWSWGSAPHGPVGGGWQLAGVFDQLHRFLLVELHVVGELDWTRASMDGSRVRAEKGEPRPVRRRSTGGRSWRTR